MIDDIAKNKFKLNQEMLRLLQEGAIDCRLNKAYNMYNIDDEDKYQCFSYNPRDMNKAFKTELKDEKSDKLYNVENDKVKIELVGPITMSNNIQF